MATIRAIFKAIFIENLKIHLGFEITLKGAVKYAAKNIGRIMAL